MTKRWRRTLVPFDPNVGGLDECTITRDRLDRLRLIRAYYKINDHAIKGSLVSIAEQLANGRSPILAFGPKLEKRRRVPKSRTLS
jgi:hypothetical protein